MHFSMHPTPPVAARSMGTRLPRGPVAAQDAAGRVAGEFPVLQRLHHPCPWAQPEQEALQPGRAAHEHLDFDAARDWLRRAGGGDRLDEPGRGRLEEQSHPAVVGTRDEHGETRFTRLWAGAGCVGIGAVSPSGSTAISSARGTAAPAGAGRTSEMRSTRKRRTSPAAPHQASTYQ